MQSRKHLSLPVGHSVTEAQRHRVTKSQVTWQPHGARGGILGADGASLAVTRRVWHRGHPDHLPGATVRRPCPSRCTARSSSLQRRPAATGAAAHHGTTWPGSATTCTVDATVAVSGTTTGGRNPADGGSPGAAAADGCGSKRHCTGEHLRRWCRRCGTGGGACTGTATGSWRRRHGTEKRGFAIIVNAARWHADHMTSAGCGRRHVWSGGNVTLSTAINDHCRPRARWFW